MGTLRTCAFVALWLTLFPFLRRDAYYLIVAGTSRHSPGSIPSIAQSPTLHRTSLSVGWPMAAVIRRTWRFRPSRMVSLSQPSGTVLRKRTGGSRGQGEDGRAHG